MKRLAIIFMISLIAVPSLAYADARQFIPVLMDYYGELSVDARYQNDQNTLNGVGVKLTDTRLVERLNLYSVGYVYHPNFITFRLNVSGGLREEKFSNTTQDLPWSTQPLDEYEFRMYVLPSHPYNLELFTVRRTPVTRATFSHRENPVSTSYGAILKYEDKPYFASLSYSQQTTDAGSITTDSHVYSANLSYKRGKLFNNASYQHTDSATNLNDRVSRNYYFLNNRYDNKKIMWHSNIAYTNQDQERQVGAPLKVSTFSIRERGEVKLPWNFESAVDFGHIRETSGSGRTALSLESESKVTSSDARFEITHRLFDSLRSRYSLAYNMSRFPNGESKTLTNSFDLDYTKRIPGGTVRAGANYQYSLLDRKGSSLVLNEQHTGSIGGTFNLNEQRAEETSIVMQVSTVVPSGDTPTFVELQKNIHYLVVPSGSTFVVTIISLPAEVCRTIECQANPGFQYSFRASYKILGEDLKIGRTLYGGRIRFELFKSLLSPYFSYYRSRQNLLSGTLLGTDEDSVNLTAGLQVQKLPIIFLVEYQDITSNVNPSRALRSELDYQGALSTSAFLFGKAHYSRTQYAPGSLGLGLQLAYTETIYGIDVRVQKSFLVPRLSVALGVAYTQTSGLNRVKTYSLNSGLNLNMGRTDIIFSGRASRSEAEGISVTQEARSEYFFLTIRRKIF
ncbi:MAG: hypothetical protein WA610_10665 [Thermodesulfovibrionales bacterium]